MSTLLRNVGLAVEIILSSEDDGGRVVEFLTQYVLALSTVSKW